MKLIEFYLNPSQVETLLLNDDTFRGQVIQKLFAQASIFKDLETLVAQIIKTCGGNKIAAIKAVRTAYLEDSILFSNCPSDYFQNSGLGLYGAKSLVDKYWEKYRPIA